MRRGLQGKGLGVDLGGLGLGDRVGAIPRLHVLPSPRESRSAYPVFPPLCWGSNRRQAVALGRMGRRPELTPQFSSQPARAYL